MRALILSVVVLWVSGCSCGGGGNGDGGVDGGTDGGIVHCKVSTDCGSAQKVCDPGSLVCVNKCMQDTDCAILGGVCTIEDGTCRPPCNMVDGGDGYCPDFMKLCKPETGHCVAKCTTDDDCVTIEPGDRCQDGTGRCINDVHGCNQDTDCNTYLDPTDYCFVGGIQCRCVTVANDAGTSGVCLRRHTSCETCTSDDQCGSSAQFDPQGACDTLPNDTSGLKYCLFQASPTCGCGYIDNGHGTCTPASGTCSAPGCSSDSDCSAGNVCDTQKCLCEQRCRWDYAAQDLAAPGCPANETCWVDSANLDPASIYYGSGRCHTPCTGDSDCNVASAANPQGGPNLKCGTEITAGGGMSAARCRANGACMDDLECPELPDTSLSYGYCDKASFVCETDCRVGDNPQTMQPYQDCRPPYGCAEDAGTRFCKLKTCFESGGAGIACVTGQYCCGEDKDNDGNPDPCPPADQLDDQGCYDAPNPPFCQTCMSAADCTNLPLPAYLQGACANGSHSPSCSPYPIECFGYQDPASGMMLGVCAPSTYNDSSLDAIGRKKDSAGCPDGFSPVYSRVGFPTDGGDDLCGSDNDCNQGTTQGHCGVDLTYTIMDGGHPHVCLCTVGASAQQCPNTPDGGVFSVCRFGNNGDTQPCIETVSCVAPNAYVFRDGGNGCGL